MDSVSPSSEPSHDQWLTLSLSIAPPAHSQAQAQPRPRPQLLQPLQTQSQPQPQLLDLLQTQPQPQPPPSLPAPFPNMPLVAPMRPSSLPPHPQEPCRQETYFLAPPFIPQPPTVHVHNLPETGMLPFCDLPLLLGHQHQDQDQDQDPTYQTHQLLVRKRKKPTTLLATKKGKSETIDPPFPWATPTRATVYSHEHLLANNIKSISGMVKCKCCNKQYDIEFDLEEKFRDIVRFVVRNRGKMHDRAPDAWTNPVLPTCKRCGQENALKPVITKKRSTNWLFLLLGQMLGCCTLAHLKFFCKHRMIHCTAAKDRLVYLTYLDLCKQLEPRGPFTP